MEYKLGMMTGNLRIVGAGIVIPVVPMVLAVAVAVAVIVDSPVREIRNMGYIVAHIVEHMMACSMERREYKEYTVHMAHTVSADSYPQMNVSVSCMVVVDCMVVVGCMVVVDCMEAVDCRAVVGCRVVVGLDKMDHMADIE